MLERVTGEILRRGWRLDGRNAVNTRWSDLHLNPDLCSARLGGGLSPAPSLASLFVRLPGGGRDVTLSLSLTLSILFQLTVTGDRQ